MNQNLTYLMDEICAGVEIYYTGRTGGQYYKTAFILCDDYTELVSKLFLLSDDPAWTDKKSATRYKNYYDVLKEVRAVVGRKMRKASRRVEELQSLMKSRRNRRNDFFHSTSLLDLSVTARNCIESFCDLFEYGEILLGDDWREAVENARNLATLEVLLQLEKTSFCNPSITQRMNDILRNWERNTNNNSKKGVHVAVYPEDLHLRLCVTCGGKDLRDKLSALLPAAVP